jgi:hypothetical protein
MSRLRASLMASTTLVLVFAPSTAATLNVVPNPGFEKSCTPALTAICGWDAESSTLLRDRNDHHSGSASVELYGGGESAWAVTAPDFCMPIGQGGHAASFWYRSLTAAGDEGVVAYVGLSATFYAEPGCTGLVHSSALGEYPAWLGAKWHEVTGEVVAPPGTASATFGLEIGFGCNICYYIEAHFDDLYVEAEPSLTPQRSPRMQTGPQRWWPTPG